jgi:hypothetical protein
MVAISFSKNQKIIFNNIIYTISRVVNLNYLIARQDETGELEKLKISDIKPYINSESLKKNKIDLTEINEKNWALANKRFEIISHLLNSVPIEKSIMLKLFQHYITYLFLHFIGGSKNTKSLGKYLL